MARPKNLAHRDALLAAATRVIASQGLAATTASIAKEAGVSAGTLFVHFETKPVLVDRLYVALKGEMGAVAVADMPVDGTPRDQLRHLWTAWIGWATEAPAKRRALAHLDVATDVTDESRESLHRSFAAIADVLERCRAGGPMQQVPLGFVLRMLDAIADATIDDLIERPGPGPALEDPRCEIAFDAIWRAIAG